MSPADAAQFLSAGISLQLQFPLRRPPAAEKDRNINRLLVLGRSGTWLAVKTKIPGDEPMSRGQTALVVDDDEGLAQIVAVILCVEGFEVRTADNGVHGYTAYFRYPTD